MSLTRIYAVSPYGAVIQATGGSLARLEIVIRLLVEGFMAQAVCHAAIGAGCHYMALGRLDAAASHLSAAMRGGEFILGWAKFDTRWEPLRGHVAGL